jgi:L-ascorbate metabolism protein UlaG (beta-lactamase superfamily)
MRQTITWLGHGSWRMNSPQGTIIYLDPWIKGNPACPISLNDIDKADVVCVTHGHSDHLGNAIEIVHKTGATLVTLPEVAAYCSRYGIPYDANGGCVHTGGSVMQRDVRIYAVFALHSSDIMGKEYVEDNELMPGSGTCGMILEPEGGVPVYFAGDTGVFGDMELLGCGILIPGHYNTFPNQTADIDDLIRQVGVRAPRTRVVALKPGESFEM